MTASKGQARSITVSVSFLVLVLTDCMHGLPASGSTSAESEVKERERLSSENGNKPKRRPHRSTDYLDGFSYNPAQFNSNGNMAIGVPPPGQPNFDLFHGTVNAAGGVDKRPPYGENPDVQDAKKPTVPQFMLDLFNRFEQDKSMQPSSNIIRSFTNKASQQDQNLFLEEFPECDFDSLASNCATKRLLLFNVSTIPMHELITMAELRLYILFQEYRWPGVGASVTIEVVEVGCSRHFPQNFKFCSKTAQHHTLTRRWEGYGAFRMGSDQKIVDTIPRDTIFIFDIFIGVLLTHAKISYPKIPRSHLPFPVERNLIY